MHSEGSRKMPTWALTAHKKTVWTDIIMPAQEQNLVGRQGGATEDAAKSSMLGFVYGLDE